MSLLVDLKLKPNSKAIFHKAHSVPFALKEQIEKEINQLLKHTLVPVKLFDFASIVVHEQHHEKLQYVPITSSLLTSLNELFSKLHRGQLIFKRDIYPTSVDIH